MLKESSFHALPTFPLPEQRSGQTQQGPAPVLSEEPPHLEGRSLAIPCTVAHFNQEYIF